MKIKTAEPIWRTHYTTCGYFPSVAGNSVEFYTACGHKLRWKIRQGWDWLEIDCLRHLYILLHAVTIVLAHLELCWPIVCWTNLTSHCKWYSWGGRICADEHHIRLLMIIEKKSYWKLAINWNKNRCTKCDEKYPFRELCMFGDVGKSFGSCQAIFKHVLDMK